jgi:hypothetical protein
MLNVLAQISFKIDYNFETFLKCTNAGGVLIRYIERIYYVVSKRKKV